eukprot:TRINITY_DN508_c0_g1_i1.p1 TRINITY_DN508_c0_g1~~TRINITY_DN508_c0_g1_i1.p1  ORF type:complete len:186 (-),score=46.23 TRINITY_DN508_c0_g1_i1:24-506(-)
MGCGASTAQEGPPKQARRSFFLEAVDLVRQRTVTLADVATKPLAFTNKDLTNFRRQLLDPAECTVGKWLAGNRPLLTTAEWAALDEKHRAFHTLAVAVCERALHGGQQQQLGAPPELDGALTAASTELQRYLLQLHSSQSRPITINCNTNANAGRDVNLE